MSALTTVPQPAIRHATRPHAEPAVRVLLLVESLTHAGETLSELLEALGYRVETSGFGAAFPESWQLPAVILADFPPEAAPLAETLGELLRTPGWNRVPIIGMLPVASTAPAWLENPPRARSLVKPVSIWALHRAIQDALASAR